MKLMKGQGQGHQDGLRHSESSKSRRLDFPLLLDSGSQGQGPRGHRPGPRKAAGRNDDLESGEKPPEEPQPWRRESLETQAQSRGRAAEENTPAFLWSCPPGLPLAGPHQKPEGRDLGRSPGQPAGHRRAGQGSDSQGGSRHSVEKEARIS